MLANISREQFNERYAAAVLDSREIAAAWQPTTDKERPLTEPAGRWIEGDEMEERMRARYGG